MTYCEEKQRPLTAPCECLNTSLNKHLRKRTKKNNFFTFSAALYLKHIFLSSFLLMSVTLQPALNLRCTHKPKKPHTHSHNLISSVQTSTKLEKMGNLTGRGGVRVVTKQYFKARPFLPHPSSPINRQQRPDAVLCATYRPFKTLLHPCRHCFIVVRLLWWNRLTTCTIIPVLYSYDN